MTNRINIEIRFHNNGSKSWQQQTDGITNEGLHFWGISLKLASIANRSTGETVHFVQFNHQIEHDLPPCLRLQCVMAIDLIPSKKVQ